MVLGPILAALLFTEPNLRHWLVIPVFASGVLIGADAVKWFRGRYDVLDPYGIIGLLGVHFFFVAPLLHVYWDAWLLYLPPLSDWRHWLGTMAWVNLVAIIVYLVIRNIHSSHGGHHKPARTMWALDPQRFKLVLFVALVLTAVLQVIVYRSYGGVSGYINSYSEQTAAFAGMGFIFAVAESFPILALFGYAAYAKGSRRTRTWIEIGIILLVFFILKILFGGLRGSRSNTIWGIFWAVGIIHLWVRPISKKLTLTGLIPLILFMYLYGFYKAYGNDVFQMYQQVGDSLLALEEQSNRTFEGVLLWDLGRADVQAYLLHHLEARNAPHNYVYRYGETYLSSLALLIPESIVDPSLDSKVHAGTDLIYGLGSFESGRVRSSRVYGLAGEAMLNFGVIAVPFAFALWALGVGLIRRLRTYWNPTDSRLLLYPLLINLCFVVLASDSDNVVFFSIKNGMLPFLVIILGSKIHRNEPHFSTEIRTSG